MASVCGRLQAWLREPGLRSLAAEVPGLLDAAEELQPWPTALPQLRALTSADEQDWEQQPEEPRPLPEMPARAVGDTAAWAEGDGGGAHGEACLADGEANVGQESAPCGLDAVEVRPRVVLAI